MRGSAIVKSALLGSRFSRFSKSRFHWRSSMKAASTCFSEADMAGGMYSRPESTRCTPPSRVAWFLLAEESAQCSPAPSLKDQWPRTTSSRLPPLLRTALFITLRTWSWSMGAA